MAELTKTVLVGVACDVSSFTAEVRPGDPAEQFSAAERRFYKLLLCEGWAKRIGRSTRWYCPAHSERAGRCVKGRWGGCSPWCPVHGHGQVVTYETEDAKRLAGQRNMLTEASR